MNNRELTPPATSGQIITENGEKYFVMGKNRIKITEHFSPTGKQIDELIAELIANKIKGNRANWNNLLDKSPHL